MRKIITACAALMFAWSAQSTPASAMDPGAAIAIGMMQSVGKVMAAGARGDASLYYYDEYGRPVARRPLMRPRYIAVPPPYYPVRRTYRDYGDYRRRVIIRRSVRQVRDQTPRLPPLPPLTPRKWEAIGQCNLSTSAGKIYKCSDGSGRLCICR